MFGCIEVGKTTYLLAVDLKISPPARPLDVGFLVVHSRRSRLFHFFYFIDMYVNVHIYAVGMMYPGGGVRKINQSKKVCFFSSIAVDLFINEPQKKKTAILNMYWTDIGLWKLMEIVKNTDIG